MKKLSKISVFLFLVFLALANAYAGTKVYRNVPDDIRIKVGIINDNPPFSWQEERTQNTKKIIYADGFFYELSKKIFDDLGFKENIIFYSSFKTMEELNKAAKVGNVDFLMGIYYSDKEFNNYELLYPPMFNNPVTIFLRPEDINKIVTWEDMDKLNGVARLDEDLSDLYNENIRNDSKITMVKDAHEAFDLLLNEKTDYFITSSYSGQAEAFKMGILERVAFVKQPKWNPNIFIGAATKSRVARIFKDDLLKTLQMYRKQNTADSVMVTVMDKWRQKNALNPPTKFSDTVFKPLKRKNNAENTIVEDFLEAPVLEGTSTVTEELITPEAPVLDETPAVTEEMKVPEVPVLEEIPTITEELTAPEAPPIPDAPKLEAPVVTEKPVESSNQQPDTLNNI